NVIDVDAVEVSLKQVVSLERKIRVCKSELSDNQLCGLRHFRDVAYAELIYGLPHFWVIGIVNAEFESVGFFQQHDVPDAYRCFTGVINSRRQFGARVLSV